MGFVTGKVSPQLQTHLTQEAISVFIPTTPNPTSGWYAIIPQQEAIDIDISIEDAFKILISGGIVSPETHTVKSGATVSRANKNITIESTFASDSRRISLEEEG